MQDLVDDFLKQKRFAVAGSFKDESKYAYRIVRTLKSKGYEVYPVNPHIKEVESLSCYASIKDIPVTIDVVDLVTPPEVTEKILRQCKESGITRVWLQPGAESDEAIRFCEENDIKVIYGLCVMLESIGNRQQS